MLVIDDLVNEKDMKNAGSKARNDINYICTNSEKEVIKLKYSGRKKYFFYLYNYLKILLKKELMIVQYPFYGMNYKICKLFYNILSKKKSILLIHDINSLRNYPDDDMEINQEIDVIKQFNCIITHNRKMSEWLKKHNVDSYLIELNAFDYLGKGSKSLECKYDICFAGNLAKEKSAFLYEAINKNKDVTFQLFGNGLENNELTTNYEYEGSVGAEELLTLFKGKYGLIWDGDTIDECNGLFGNYERYNNPHKMSLYIASGLPIIVWKKAAVAEFVEKQNIGITVDNLNDLVSVINKITEEDYNEMKDNICKLSIKVKEGYFTRNAIEKAKEFYNEKF